MKLFHPRKDDFAETAADPERRLAAIVRLTRSSTYQTSDDAFKERLLLVCWDITFSATPEVRERMAIFLKGVFEQEHDATLRNWAATDLAYCGLPDLDGMYMQMLKSDEPVMWPRGAAGLWFTRSQPAITMLVGQVKVRETNSNFARVVRQMVLQDSNQYTGILIQTLNTR